MKKRARFQRLRMALAVVLGAVCLAPPVQELAKSPSDVYVPLGQWASVPIGLPNYTHVHNSNNRVVSVRSISSSHDLSVISHDVGDCTLSTDLFGFVPWKSVRVHVVPTEMVCVGGQSVGIRIHSNGVLVVGFQRVGRNQTSPAANSKLQIGDVIEEINHHRIMTSADIRRCVNESEHGKIELLIRRVHRRLKVDITPCEDGDGIRHLGIYARDKTAGVGTLTFYEPRAHRFGALGHIITDVDTGQPISGTGALYEAEVTGVVRGSAGQPGEKRGRFVHQSIEIGHIEENTPYGVYGTMDNAPEHISVPQELPVALPSQVHEGPAKMYTVVDGERVQAFDVEIENLVRQDKPETKSMVIHVTDPRLIQISGGIVQGMSGSPLVQDGKLVGAVTHVFVSDPTRGYGVYAAWMLKECESFAKTANNVIKRTTSAV